MSLCDRLRNFRCTTFHRVFSYPVTPRTTRFCCMCGRAWLAFDPDGKPPRYEHPPVV